MWFLVRGGLGNQMFQAALACVLSERFGAKPSFLDLTDRARVERGWQLDCFALTPVRMERSLVPAVETGLALVKAIRQFGVLPTSRVVVENALGDYVEFNTRPYLVSGYWQNPRYFKGFEHEIRALFQLPTSLSAAPGSFLRSKPKVAIHMRRGDYVTDPSAQSVHLVCDEAWYQEAWRAMLGWQPDAHAYVFSDDPDWARACLGEQSNLTYMPFSQVAHPAADLALMSQCDHFVISNSSYSWWAAWLGTSAGKKVIAPREWFRGRSTADLGVCPSDWTLL
jgi:hypothetical protein